VKDQPGSGPLSGVGEGDVTGGALEKRRVGVGIPLLEEGLEAVLDGGQKGIGFFAGEYVAR
jgi:hypothetical protein